jgi:DNA-binding transcriptional regulator YiaG
MARHGETLAWPWQTRTMPVMSTEDLKLLVEARAATHTGAAVKVRRAARLSQGELARAAGINPGTLSRWESLERQPTGPAAVRYARVLRALAGAAAVDAEREKAAVR